MVNHESWNQIVGPERIVAAANIARILTQSRNAPDALLITDDNLVSDATRGLRAGGIRGPEQMDVVAWANFPCPPKAHVPVRFLGLDVPAFLAECVRVLRQARAGQETVPSIPLPLRFE